MMRSDDGEYQKNIKQKIKSINKKVIIDKERFKETKKRKAFEVKINKKKQQ